ncbi:MAG: hypothetical protein HGA25_11525, partial [Clostridiales bacterium]|nr:hypothetical protein [Clostridiales bacterium]
MVGKMAKVKAGHDKDKIYIIVRDDEKFVYLADGKLKTLQNPKKKSKKHIQPILHKIDETSSPLEEEQQYLAKNGFIQAHESAQKIDFIALKKKFDATSFESDDPSQHLYKVLKKINA